MLFCKKNVCLQCPLLNFSQMNSQYGILNSCLRILHILEFYTGTGFIREHLCVLFQYYSYIPDDISSSVPPRPSKFIMDLPISNDFPHNRIFISDL